MPHQVIVNSGLVLANQCHDVAYYDTSLRPNDPVAIASYDAPRPEAKSFRWYTSSCSPERDGRSTANYDMPRSHPVLIAIVAYLAIEA